MVGSGEGAAVEVVDESTGALVAALADAVDSADGVAVLVIERLNGLEELLGGPGVGVLVDVLVGAGLDKGGVVDRHAVGGHDDGVLVGLAVFGEARGESGGVDLGLVGIIEHVADVDHVAVGAPVGDETLGAFHDQVGSLLGGDGGVDLVVAVGVGQELDLDLDAGLGGEGVGQSLDDFFVAPVADGVGPKGDLGRLGGSGFGGSGLGGSSLGGLLGGGRSGLLSAGGQREDHHEREEQCKNLLHFGSS